MPNRNTRKGFTLTEILVALAIFALGGTAIMALFITNVRLSRQAMDYTRAAEITRNIRSLMTQSLSRPININDDDNGTAIATSVWSAPVTLTAGNPPSAP